MLVVCIHSAGRQNGASFLFELGRLAAHYLQQGRPQDTEDQEALVLVLLRSKVECCNLDTLAAAWCSRKASAVGFASGDALLDRLTLSLLFVDVVGLRGTKLQVKQHHFLGTY